MKNNLRVAFFPYGFLQENPYQNQLIAGLEANNIEVIKIPGRKLFPLLQIIKYKPDIVHLFWPHDFYIGKNNITTILKRAMLCLTLPILKHYTTVYSADNLVSHDINMISAETEKVWISKILRQCKGIIYMSNAASELYRNFYRFVPEKQLIISHVNFNKSYPNNLNKSECREALSLNKEITFCVFGRIHPYKGVIAIIEAFKQLDNPETVLLIAGKCSSEDYLQQIITASGSLYQDRIRVVNKYIDDAAVQIYLKAADYLLLNYIDTPLNPGSAILADTFNIPLIAPKTAVLKEIAGKSGNYFFEQNNSTSLLNALKEVCSTAPITKLHSADNSDSDPISIGRKLKVFYLSFLNKSN